MFSVILCNCNWLDANDKVPPLCQPQLIPELATWAPISSTAATNAF